MLKIFKKNKKNHLDKDSLIHQENDEQWMEDEYEEGQLSIDVYETSKEIFVKSTIAGVDPEEIDISIDNDMLTIRGERKEEELKEGANYLYKECYWGAFSRSIILPVEVDEREIEAELENGVLTIILKKIKSNKKIGIKIKS